MSRGRFPPQHGPRPEEADEVPFPVVHLPSRFSTPVSIRAQSIFIVTPAVLGSKPHADDAHPRIIANVFRALNFQAEKTLLQNKTRQNKTKNPENC